MATTNNIISWFSTLKTFSYYQKKVFDYNSEVFSGGLTFDAHCKEVHNDLMLEMDIFQAKGTTSFFEYKIPLTLGKYPNVFYRDQDSYYCSEHKRLCNKMLNECALTDSDYECLIHLETLSLYRQLNFLGMKTVFFELSDIRFSYDVDGTLINNRYTLVFRGFFVQKKLGVFSEYGTDGFDILKNVTMSDFLSNYGNWKCNQVYFFNYGEMPCVSLHDTRELLYSLFEGFLALLFPSYGKKFIDMPKGVNRICLYNARSTFNEDPSKCIFTFSSHLLDYFDYGSDRLMVHSVQKELFSFFCTDSSFGYRMLLLEYVDDGNILKRGNEHLLFDMFLRQFNFVSFLGLFVFEHKLRNVFSMSSLFSKYTYCYRGTLLYYELIFYRYYLSRYKSRTHTIPKDTLCASYMSPSFFSVSKSVGFILFLIFIPASCACVYYNIHPVYAEEIKLLYTHLFKHSLTAHLHKLGFDSMGEQIIVNHSYFRGLFDNRHFWIVTDKYYGALTHKDLQSIYPGTDRLISKTDIINQSKSQYFGHFLKTTDTSIFDNVVDLNNLPKRLSIQLAERKTFFNAYYENNSTMLEYKFNELKEQSLEFPEEVPYFAFEILKHKQPVLTATELDFYNKHVIIFSDGKSVKS